MKLHAEQHESNNSIERNDDGRQQKSPFAIPIIRLISLKHGALTIAANC